MNTASMPEQITQYNLYNSDDKFVGITEITLPTFDPQTNTISGAGINGEYESSVPGAFGSSEIEIPFRIFNQQAADLMKVDGSILFLRAAVKETEASTLKIRNKQMKVTIGGEQKGLTLGTCGNGKTMDSSVKLEVKYYKHEYDNLTLLEIDKLNNVYVVNGVDQLADIKSMI